MTALLNTYWGNMEKVRSAVTECRRLGIQVLPPDINESNADFTIEKGKDNPAIRFGLVAIKNVGPSPIEHILSTRSQSGAFTSIKDFCHRANLHNVNKKVLESLMKAGAFDSLGSRGALLNSINKIISLAQTEQRMKESGQTSMLDLWTEASPAFTSDSELEKGEAIPTKQKLDWERELLGVYFSSPLFDSLVSDLPSSCQCKEFISCGDLSTDMASETVVIAGMVASIRHAYTRDKHPFIIAALEALDGSVEVAAWPRFYESTKELWEEGNILVIKGLVKVRDGKVQLNCQQAQRYQHTEQKNKVPPSQEQRCLIINLNQTDNTDKDVERLYKIKATLLNYPGQYKVFLTVTTESETTNLEMPEITIDYCPELASELDNILGEGNLKFEDQFR